MTAAKLSMVEWWHLRWLRPFRLAGLSAIIMLILLLPTNSLSQNLSPTTVTYLPIINESLKLTSHIIAQSNDYKVDTLQLTITNISTKRALLVAPDTLRIRYRDSQQRIDALPWSWEFQGEHNNDNMLDKGEHLHLKVDVQKALQLPLSANQPFILELQPQDGAILRIHRTTPPQLISLIDLQ